MAEEYTDVIFVKVDVDEADEVAASCGISAMPTFQYYKNETKIDEFCGASKSDIRNKVEKHK